MKVLGNIEKLAFAMIELEGFPVPRIKFPVTRKYFPVIQNKFPDNFLREIFRKAL